MEKELTFNANNPIEVNIEKAASNVRKPLLALARYYSSVLDRPINLKQTLLLLNAQTAFLMAAFPVECPLLLRAACGYWLYRALMRCKEALKR